jgi:hypothetical protein
MPTIQSIAGTLNAKAGSYQIGKLQDLRKELKGLARRPGRSIFTKQTIDDDWAFHHGGRSELQFNIGFDGSKGRQLRYGVAFSFETSRTLPDIEVLRPKVDLFNEYLTLYPAKYSHLRMWDWVDNERGEDYPTSMIPKEKIRNKTFVFFGCLRPISSIDYDEILREFDDLLPLYTYVESKGKFQSVDVLEPVPFEFKPGCTVKKLKTSAKIKSGPIDVTLLHCRSRRDFGQFGGEFGPGQWLRVGSDWLSQGTAIPAA